MITRRSFLLAIPALGLSAAAFPRRIRAAQVAVQTFNGPMADAGEVYRPVTLPPKPGSDLAKKGVSGELWAVHGGGFYNPQKYLVSPAELPADLHWFKWEAYATWLSGFALLFIVYYFNASAMMGTFAGSPPGSPVVSGGGSSFSTSIDAIGT